MTLPWTKVGRRKHELCPELRVVSMETPALCSGRETEVQGKVDGVLRSGSFSPQEAKDGGSL